MVLLAGDDVGSTELTALPIGATPFSCKSDVAWSESLSGTRHPISQLKYLTLSASLSSCTIYVASRAVNQGNSQ